MTAVLERPRQEAPPSMPHGPIDHEALALERELRYEQRKARLDDDVHLHPRLRQIFLDRTLIGTKEVTLLLDFTGPSRVSVLRSNGRIYGSTFPHPAVLPPMDKPLAGRDDRPPPAYEYGRIAEWAFDSHRLIFNVRTGKLEINTSWRAGRKRLPAADRKRKYRLTGVDGRRAGRGVPHKKAS